MTTFFQNRRAAGKLLAVRLDPYLEKKDVIVLALPRGGVPVGFEIARALHVPLDLMLVRKLGVPGDEELAMGAIAMNDICVFNHDVIQGCAVPDVIVDRVVQAEKKELVRRNQAYRGGEPPPDAKGQTVILVDDGMATGANMHAAATAVARQQPARIVAAVPIASDSACGKLETVTDELVCLQIPPFFYGVGNAYEDFRQTTDEEVKSLLEEARRQNSIGLSCSQTS